MTAKFWPEWALPATLLYWSGVSVRALNEVSVRLEMAMPDQKSEVP
jgi:hypothetical protein